MTLIKNLVRNTSWIFISDIIGNLLSFFLIILIARYLGDQGLGIYSYAIAFVSFFFFILDTGTLFYTVTIISRDIKKTEEYAKNLLTIRFVFCFFAFLAAIILGYIIQKEVETNLTIFLAGIAMFFNYFSWTFRPIFQAHSKLKFEAISKIIERIVAFGLGAFLLIFLKVDIVFFMVTFIVSYISFFILRTFFVKTCTSLKFGFDYVIIKKILKGAIPFWFIMIFLKLYFTMDTLMISWFTGSYAAVGWYNAAYRIIDGLRFIPAAISLVLWPVMAGLFVKNQKTLRSLLDFSYKYLFMLIFPLAIGVIVLSEKFILFFYTAEFTNSIFTLQLLIVAGSLGFIAQFFGIFLQAINKQNFYALTVGICTIVNIILNCILIPHYSYIGAAIATILTEIIALVLFYAFVSKLTFAIPLIKMSFHSIIAGTFMGLILLFLRNYCHLLILIIGSILLYFLILILIKGIHADEFNLLKQAIKRKTNG